MSEEHLIKSNKRVKEHGEVFTPKRVVKLMLNQHELYGALHSLTATFLEPAAGEGAFLTEMLSRKLELANHMSSDIKGFEQNALIALTSLYGIELLVDNTDLLVMHMYQVFYQEYLRQLSKYNAPENNKVLKSALTIIKANMAQGDALTGKNKNGDDIIFSEWNLLPVKRGVQKVKRIEYTLDAIKTGGPSVDGQHQTHGYEELSLFESTNEEAQNTVYRFKTVPLIDVFKEIRTSVLK
ncbi:N-6 DNA methylase [Lacticaseibacillus paracasei]|uniref:N-6 DNA methylase n=1 Tax=Lacticaseibacillus paracasei TaxID=1597 RepID=UPI0021A83E15|nr:N-6 DNA methylase [Lacticaseibacillus paracasei]MCT4385032.1 DNA methyltransferase [Lacticaseibacillus paracasei]